MNNKNQNQSPSSHSHSIKEHTTHTYTKKKLLLNNQQPFAIRYAINAIRVPTNKYTFQEERTETNWFGKQQFSLGRQIFFAIWSDAFANAFSQQAFVRVLPIRTSFNAFSF